MPVQDDIGRALRLECSPILKEKPGGGSRKASAAAASSGADKDVVTSTSSLNTDLHLGAVVRIDTGAVLPTPLPPPPRTILYTDPSTPINSANTFRTVCYNVLAQIYATRQVYPYTSIWALSWEYRKTLLLRDILSHHADVICLQEVQSNHFETFFQPQLSKQGYDGIFKRKTRDAGNDSAGNQMIDGCATFYKRDRFALMEQYGIEFNEAARQHTANRTQLRRLLKGNIALVLVLEELSPPPSSSAAAAARRNRKRRLCITNTHIFWDPVRTQACTTAAILRRSPMLTTRSACLLSLTPFLCLLLRALACVFAGVSRREALADMGVVSGAGEARAAAKSAIGAVRRSEQQA